METRKRNLYSEWQKSKVKIWKCNHHLEEKNSVFKVCQRKERERERVTWHPILSIWRAFFLYMHSYFISKRNKSKIKSELKMGTKMDDYFVSTWKLLSIRIQHRCLCLYVIWYTYKIYYIYIILGNWWHFQFDGWQSFNL